VGNALLSLSKWGLGKGRLLRKLRNLAMTKPYPAQTDAYQEQIISKTPDFPEQTNKQTNKHTQNTYFQ